MASRQIPSEEWVGFLDTFSRQYRGRRVEVQIFGEGLGVYSMAHGQPLIGVTAQIKNGPREIEVIAADPASNITHVVKDPSRVWLQQEKNGGDSVLKIEAKDGISVLIDCGSAAAGTGPRSQALS